LKIKWINVLELLINELKKTRRDSTVSSAPQEEDLPEQRSRTSSTVGSKKWKKNQQDLETMEILKKSGFTDKDDESSLKAVKLKFKNLNIDLPDVKSRVHFGFLMKKHKKEFIYQKRWFFLISSRPLNDQDYENDDKLVYKNPAGIQMDTLYYFTFDNDSDDSTFKGDIPLR
jgi:hypothetical protein